ncbi:nuclear transport factor 2 family protein [Williamsia sp.]|uniref:nuclear transport factor 2 family protein n=1 Tax=Williamsia sp. TaxID=1872085 RepID=UPI002F938E35
MTTQIPELPASVTAYLAAAPGADPAIIAGLFAPDAVVVDDGHIYRGRAEIVSWRTDVARSFTYTTTRLHTDLHDHSVVVAERIEGNFPGGRIDLASRFAVDTTGQISSLTIAPATGVETSPATP